MQHSRLAAPGDLDPRFADVGRFVPSDFLGPALSVAAQHDRIIVAGGGVIRLSSTGTLDATFAAPGLNGVMVVDAKLQSVGKIVATMVRAFWVSRIFLFGRQRMLNRPSSRSDAWAARRAVPKH